MQYQWWHARTIARAAMTCASSPRRQRLIGALLIAAGCAVEATTALAEDGKAIFEGKCAACHSIGKGRLLGPDLAGVSDRRPEDWLIKFIKSPDAVLKSGDAAAKALFDEYKMPMPDQALSDGQIKDVLAHIKTAGGAPAASGPAAAAQAKPVAEAHPEDIQRGQALFEGKLAFAGGGPSCNACHHVTSESTLGGGILASELTLVFSRMGQEGVRAILGSSPFPVMQAAYAGKQFSEDEVRALVGFLQHVDKEHSRHMPVEYGWRMLSAGVGGVLVLLVIYSLAGRRRKKRSVNQDIYDRQVKSE